VICADRRGPRPPLRGGERSRASLEAVCAIIHATCVPNMPTGGVICGSPRRSVALPACRRSRVTRRLSRRRRSELGAVLPIPGSAPTSAQNEGGRGVALERMAQSQVGAKPRRSASLVDDEGKGDVGPNV